MARIPASVSNVTRTYRLGLLAVSIFGAKRVLMLFSVMEGGQ